MATRHAIVQNHAGIHCRPSAVIVEEVKDYPGNITVTAKCAGEEMSSDLRSIIGVICLGLQTGAEVTIQVEGDRAEAMADKVKSLFERHFDFPPREK